jgi:hypothetical protein
MADATNNHTERFSEGELRRMSVQELADLARRLEVPFDPAAGADELVGLILARQGPKGNGLRAMLRRGRRRLIAKVVSKLLGQHGEQGEHGDQGANGHEGRSPTLEERMEQRGVMGGLAEGLRGAADQYVAAKLDEIEQRIDRKLEDIDLRLAEWRDREIANRLRIIKITLVASVLVALLSVAMAWMKKRFGW